MSSSVPVLTDAKGAFSANLSLALAGNANHNEIRLTLYQSGILVETSP